MPPTLGRRRAPVLYGSDTGKTGGAVRGAPARVTHVRDRRTPQARRAPGKTQEV